MIFGWASNEFTKQKTYSGGSTRELTNTKSRGGFNVNARGNFNESSEFM